MLDSFDEAMITFALRDAFPRMQVVTGISSLREPKLTERASLAPTEEHDDVTLDVLFPEEGWQPQFDGRNASRDPFYPVDAWFYELANAPRHRIFYRRGFWWWNQGHYGEPHNWSFSFPTPGVSDIVIDYDRQDESDRVFVRDVWRVLNRLMTNRMKSELPHLGVVYAADARWGLRAGHHVLEWCGEVYDRMLDGRLRPVDGWAAPDTPWHRDLRARVIRKYGDDFGVPSRRTAH